MSWIDEELEKLNNQYSSDFDTVGSSSAGDYALPAYLTNQLTGAEAISDVFGFDSSTLRELQEEQEQELSTYRPRVEGLFQAKNFSEGVDWWTDQATLNSLNQIVPVLGYTTAGILQAFPNPIAKGLGKIIGTTTFASQYNAELGDTLQEHEERKGGAPLTTPEKLKAGTVAGFNTLLDYLVPGRISKDVVKQLGGMKNVNKLREQIIETAGQKKLGLLDSFYKGSKYVGGKAVLEGGTEGLQKATQIGTSVDPGYLGTEEGLQSIVEEAVAAGPISGVLSTPAAVGVATEQNRARNQAIRQAEAFNQQRLLQGDVQNIIQNIPEQSGPLQFARKRLEQTGIAKQLQSLADVSVNKAPMVIKRARDDVINRDVADKSGAYNKLNNILQSILPVSSISGEQQVTVNYDRRKSQYTGQLLQPVTQVLNKYADKKYLGLGNQVIPQEINDYIRKVFRGELAPDSNTNLVSKTDMEVLLNAREEAFQLLNRTTGIKREENYIAEPISVDAVKKDKEGFIKDLLETSKKVYYADKKRLGSEFNPDGYIFHENEITARENAENIADSIINGRDPNVVTSKYVRDQVEKEKQGKGKESFEKRRSEEWRGLPDKYREQDVGIILEGYLQKAAARAASAELFGANNANKLQKDVNDLYNSGAINGEEVNRIWDMYDAVHNIYQRDTTENQRNLRNASKVITEISAITHLGLATFSSLTELIWIGEKSGFGNMLATLPKAFDYSFKGVRKFGGRKGPEKESEGWITLGNLGHNLNPAVNERLDSLFNTDKSMVVNAFFRSPFGSFLTQWTNFNRNWAAMAGMSLWNNRANALEKGTLSAIEKRRLMNELKENGVTLNEFKQIAELSKQNGRFNVNVIDDKFLNTQYTKDDGTVTDVRSTLIPYIHKIVDEVVVHPRGYNKPLWMSNPSFAAIAQLKSFPIVFGNTVVKRLLRKIDARNCTSDMGLAVSAVAAMGMAFAVAYLAEQIKSSMRGKDPRDFTWIDYANTTGLSGAFGTVLGAERYGDVTTSILGPGINSINELFTNAIGPFTEGDFPKAGENMVEWFTKSLDNGLGPAGIYYRPSAELFGVEDE